MSALLDDLIGRGWQPPVEGGDSPAIDYPDETRNQLNEIEDESPWFKVRNDVIETLLIRVGTPAGLVEVGAGNGSVAGRLRSSGIDVLAVEPGADGAANCRRRGLNTLNTSLEGLAFPDDSLPAIGVFDVLEHLGDAGPLVTEAHRTITAGGLLVVTVPAWRLLWSQSDEFAGHHRRHTLKSLDALIEPVGFQREACSYFFTVGAAFSLFRRALPYRLGRRKSHQEMIDDSIAELNPSGRAVPKVIRSAGAIECRLIAGGVRLPIGTSLGAVYRKIHI